MEKARWRTYDTQQTVFLQAKPTLTDQDNEHWYQRSCCSWRPKQELFEFWSTQRSLPWACSPWLPGWHFSSLEGRPWYTLPDHLKAKSLLPIYRLVGFLFKTKLLCMITTTFSLLRSTYLQSSLLSIMSVRHIEIKIANNLVSFPPCSKHVFHKILALGQLLIVFQPGPPEQFPWNDARRSFKSKLCSFAQSKFNEA